MLGTTQSPEHNLLVSCQLEAVIKSRLRKLDFPRSVIYLFQSICQISDRATSTPSTSSWYSEQAKQIA